MLLGAELARRPIRAEPGEPGGAVDPGAVFRPRDHRVPNGGDMRVSVGTLRFEVKCWPWKSDGSDESLSFFCSPDFAPNPERKIGRQGRKANTHW